MKNILSQIIALTKSIYLIEPIGEISFMQQFFAGKREEFSFTGGIGVSWWHTKATLIAIESISFMITKEITEFSECDHESIQELIRTVFYEICIDKNIFNGDDVLFSKTKRTLFDCRLDINIEKYANYILAFVLEKIRLSISDWCVVYVVPRLTGESFLVTSEAIKIINKKDNVSWNELASSGYLTNNIQQETGAFIDGRPSAFSSIPYDYLFVSLSHGTVEGSKFNTSLKLRKLFSIIYAISNIENGNSYHKVMAKPPSYSIQFPHKSSDIRSISASTIGELMPYYAENNILNGDTIEKIQQWYEIQTALDDEQKNRINKCAHYINKGMNSDDIDSYIHFFVSLDALYGKQGAVEASIKKGVSFLPQTDNWNEKISWLFDLRNELVHGGSRYIQEWPRYMRYYKHFSSKPEKDVEKLALVALISSPALMREFNNSCSNVNAVID